MFRLSIERVPTLALTAKITSSADLYLRTRAPFIVSHTTSLSGPAVADFILQYLDTAIGECQVALARGSSSLSCDTIHVAFIEPSRILMENCAIGPSIVGQ